MTTKRSLAALAACCLLLPTGCSEERPQPVAEPGIHWNPEQYICYRAARGPTIDGKLDDDAWAAAEWTRDFGDIQGDPAEAPRFRTRAKMLWDDDYFYVAAEMEEPHVWGKLTERDSVIYHDNDFEVFIDPDGDTHDYYELEINALGTEWDLLLTRPYRDDGEARNEWDIAGLETAIFVDGTLNRADDTDLGWSVEIAIPWEALRERANRPVPPTGGDKWRVNFSRVEWRTDFVDGEYVKRHDAETDQPLPEDNWTWSPQGLIRMHYPEMWGFVQFSDKRAGAGADPFFFDGHEQFQWRLRRIYYRQSAFYAAHGRYAEDLAQLDTDGRLGLILGGPAIRLAGDGYDVTLVLPGGGKLHLTEDGRVWKTDE
ncbi:MAG: carbohydrate-binding family 9-like protein [bacterium]|nr:carbohydrate-binding family 9-like protein [bacterium]